MHVIICLCVATAMRKIRASHAKKITIFQTKICFYSCEEKIMCFHCFYNESTVFHRSNGKREEIPSNLGKALVKSIGISTCHFIHNGAANMIDACSSRYNSWDRTRPTLSQL